jgi:hypothetical protein
MNEQEKEPLMLLEALVLAKQLGNGHFVGRWNERSEWADPECRFYTNGCGLIWDATNAQRDPSLSEAARIIRPAKREVDLIDAMAWAKQDDTRTFDMHNTQYRVRGVELQSWVSVSGVWCRSGASNWEAACTIDEGWEDVTAQVRVVVE